MTNSLLDHPRIDRSRSFIPHLSPGQLKYSPDQLTVVSLHDLELMGCGVIFFLQRLNLFDSQSVLFWIRHDLIFDLIQSEGKLCISLVLIISLWHPVFLYHLARQCILHDCPRHWVAEWLLQIRGQQHISLLTESLWVFNGFSTVEKCLLID